MATDKRKKQRTTEPEDGDGSSSSVAAVTVASSAPSGEMLQLDVHIVTPGEVITNNESGFMRGHGTHVEDGKLIASVAGVVERVNKLISVRPLRARYTGEIGDVVVCRILEVSQRRWKVDTNSRQDAVLMLSSINLPGGVQRRKSEEDELNMRRYYEEGDLLSAKVESFFQDGAMSLHTRSMKYGKLKNGSLVVVPPALVKRSQSHFLNLPCSVDVILGLNGYIWVSRHSISSESDDLHPEAPNPDDRHVEDSEREAIARVCNCIKALASKFMYIYETSIVYTFESSLEFTVKDLLRSETINTVTTRAREQIMQFEHSKR